MTTTFNTTHKDHALAHADTAVKLGADTDLPTVATIVATVGSAVVHALLEVASAINDHARDTR